MENLNSPDEADYLGELGEVVEGVLHEHLMSILETLKGRFAQVVIIMHDGSVLSAASAELDDSDEALDQVVVHIADAADNAAQLLSPRTIN